MPRCTAAASVCRCDLRNSVFSPKSPRLCSQRTVLLRLCSTSTRIGRQYTSRRAVLVRISSPAQRLLQSHARTAPRRFCRGRLGCRATPTRTLPLPVAPGLNTSSRTFESIQLWVSLRWRSFITGLSVGIAAIVAPIACSRSPGGCAAESPPACSPVSTWRDESINRDGRRAVRGRVTAFPGPPNFRGRGARLRAEARPARPARAPRPR